MSAGATRGRLRQVIPWLWLAISLLWAVVIIVTDELGWPLAVDRNDRRAPHLSQQDRSCPGPRARAGKETANDYIGMAQATNPHVRK